MSSLAIERAYLVEEISQLATKAVSGIAARISCVRQKSFPISTTVVRELWPGRSNLSGAQEPPMVDPATLSVTEIDLPGFLSTRVRLPKVTIVELGLEATPGTESLAKYWNYGLRLGFAGDPAHLLHKIGFKGPKTLGNLDMIIKPVEESELKIPLHVADLRAFRNFLQLIDA